MANTRMTAPNTFTKGLVMDFNPTITKSDCLVNALNATLLTFNGNEMQLQQDMGNGRVETALLPEGYVPVGACEFGDIIYVVSYNPLENKSQIGCFPSPERNITSDEVTDLQQSLAASDFQELNGSTPTGVIKSMSVKKIVYGNKNMNPGDKFIIYEEAAANQSILQENQKTLSDYGNTLHIYNEWPKLLKLKVVSIEDSGKIVDLNAAVKWYDNDYYLTHLQTQPAQSKPDIDSYRSLVSSAYSIFQSKVSGKLAILAELESIDGFSCTYDVYTTLDPETNKMTYKVYFYTAWETEHNDINPLGFIFTKSEWAKDIDGGYVYIPSLSSDGTYVEYIKSDHQTELPLKGAATLVEGVPGYDFAQVKHYTRTYELENPSSTFNTYIEQDSYNAKITDIIDWNKVEDKYTAIVTQTDYTNLRSVTKVSRLLNTSSGEPVLTDNGEYQYMYNLDSYESKNTEEVTYFTKGLNGNLIQVQPTVLKDDVINNYFHKDIPTLVTENFELPQKVSVEIGDTESLVDVDLTRMIWNYSVAPVMPYGVLDYLEISGNIDFSKLGTGLIDLIAWKYYNSGNISTLTWGLDAYAEPNKGIAEVVFDFYDNQGCAASYHITGKTSYAGTFTEQIVLGQQNSSYKLNSVDAYGKSYIHAGVEDTEGTIYLTFKNKPTTTKTGFGPYKNDAGTLYPNILYLVRITVKYCPKDIIGNYNTDNVSGYKTFYRWYWTNGLFNEMYYNTADFKDLQPRLGLDFSVTFNTKGGEGTNALNPKQSIYMNSAEVSYSEGKDKLYRTLGANVYSINQDYEDDATGNILMTLSPGLSEGFDTFNLNKDKLDQIKEIYVKMGRSSITKSIEAPSTVHSGEAFTSILDDSAQPIVATSLCSHDSTGFDRSGYAGYNYGTNNSIVSDNLLKLLQDKDTPDRKTATYISGDTPLQSSGNTNKEIYTDQSAYESYLDSFSLNLIDSDFETKTPLTYYDSEGNQQTLNHYQYKNITLKAASESGIKLVLAGTTYSKMFASEMTKDSASKVLKSIIHNGKSGAEDSSPKAAGLHLYEGHMYFNNVITWYMGESGGKSTRWGSFHSKNITGNTWKGSDVNGTTNASHNEWRPKIDHNQVQELWKSQISGSPLAAFMICRSSSDNGNIDRVDSDVSWDKIRSSFGLSKLGARIHKNKNECPTQHPNGWTGECAYIHSFMVYDQEQNLVVPIADYFVGAVSPVSQKKRSGNSVPTETLADMLGSLFAQLYAVDTTADSDSGLLGNFVTLQQFSEYWNKDIIVEVKTDEIDNQNDLYELITIQTQTMKNYLDYLKENSEDSYPKEEDQNNNNVTLQLYGSQRVFSFKFEVPYNLGNLVYLNNQKSISGNKIMLSVLEDGKPKVETFTGSVTPNTLYTWTGSNILQLGPGSTMQYATKFDIIDGELYMTAGKTNIKSSSFGSIAKVLQYDNGEISWGNLSQFNTWNSKYQIRYRGSGDDPYLKDLPIVSFFNLYKPGQ